MSSPQGSSKVLTTGASIEICPVQDIPNIYLNCTHSFNIPPIGPCIRPITERMITEKGINMDELLDNVTERMNYLEHPEAMSLNIRESDEEDDYYEEEVPQYIQWKIDKLTADKEHLKDELNKYHTITGDLKEEICVLRENGLGTRHKLEEKEHLLKEMRKERDQKIIDNSKLLQLIREYGIDMEGDVKTIEEDWSRVDTGSPYRKSLGDTITTTVPEDGNMTVIVDVEKFNLEKQKLEDIIIKGKMKINEDKMKMDDLVHELSIKKELLEVQNGELKQMNQVITRLREEVQRVRIKARSQENEKCKTQGGLTARGPSPITQSNFRVAPSQLALNKPLTISNSSKNLRAKTERNNSPPFKQQFNASPMNNAQPTRQSTIPNNILGISPVQKGRVSLNPKTVNPTAFRLETRPMGDPSGFFGMLRNPFVESSNSYSSEGDSRGDNK